MKDIDFNRVDIEKIGKMKDIFFAAYNAVKKIVDLFDEDLNYTIPISTNEIGQLNLLVGMISHLYGKATDQKLKAYIVAAHDDHELLDDWYNSIIDLEKKADGEKKVG